MRRYIYVFALDKVDIGLIPAPLRDLPNVDYVEETPEDIRLESDSGVHTGCTVSAPENVQVRLDAVPPYVCDRPSMISAKASISPDAPWLWGVSSFYQFLSRNPLLKQYTLIGQLGLNGTSNVHSEKTRLSKNSGDLSTLA